MFTGIIEQTGRLEKKAKNRLVLHVGHLSDELKIGQSVAVDGCCLTVVEIVGPLITMDVMSETLKKTVLGKRKKGDLLNLERAMKMGDRFEGHMVSGHVESIAKLIDVKEDDIAHYLKFKAPENLSNFMIPKGSVTLNGISLTLIDVKDDTFSVGIIPHTWHETNFHQLRMGDCVNLETDILFKYSLKLQEESEQ